MTLLVFAAAAFLLSIERLCYIWAWRDPESFRRFSANPVMSVFGSPVAVLQVLFYCFKGIQLSVFFGWSLFFGKGCLAPLGGNMLSIVLGGILIATGQFLNVSVFHRLGEVGFFTGIVSDTRSPGAASFPFRF
jgi:phosphatidyl-N-methylethanolamine N-methyltransferase